MPIRLVIAVLLALLTPAAALAADGKKEKGDFVHIDTLTATVIGPGGRHQVMTVQSGVDAPDPKVHAYAELVQPRLRDAYAQALQTYAAGMPAGGAPDADYIARLLQEATDRVLKRPGGRFLLGGIMVN